MDLARFRMLLAAFGADVSAWPEAEVEPALALMATSTQAQDLFAADVVEAAEGEPKPDVSRLADRILDKTAGKI